jgi:hypothetical protein
VLDGVGVGVADEAAQLDEVHGFSFGAASLLPWHTPQSRRARGVAGCVHAFSERFRWNTRSRVTPSRATSMTVVRTGTALNAHPGRVHGRRT